LRKAVVLTICSALLLAGCTPASDVSRNETFGVNARGKGVDGMTVGHRLMEAGEHELALKAYLRGAGETGINADVLSAIGSANLALGRLGQSEKILERALELDPNYVPALNNLGVVMMEQGKTGEARVYFQKAFALDSGQTDSIRENLMLAIAQSEANVYDPNQEQEKSGFRLVRQEKGKFVLLSDL
jgi:tetratricopeptide (TPR) repeat protein